MKILDNVNKTVKDDLAVTIEKGDKLSIAAACFSIYAYQALKKQLDGIDELRFVFTSPTFLKEKAPKEKREFYSPRLNRERSLYGTEFEVELRMRWTVHDINVSSLFLGSVRMQGFHELSPDSPNRCRIWRSHDESCACCPHGCKYPCYAFLQKKRFGQVKSYKEWHHPLLVSNTLELLDQ